MKKSCLFGVVAGTVFFCQTAVAAVITLGTGHTESAALHEAMRSAVEEEVGVALQSQSIMVNYEVRDKVFTHAEGYIQKYEILESWREGDWYKVRIRAEVSKRLQEDLMSHDMRQSVIGANMQDPRLGVIVLDEYKKPVPSAENAFIMSLQDAGFSRIVDLDQIDHATKYRLANAAFHDQYELLQALRAQENVDYMVVAKLSDVSNTHNTIPGFGGFRSGHVTMAVRMFNVNTGEIVYADSVRCNSAHTDSVSANAGAVMKAAKKIAAKLSAAALKKAANPEQHLHLIVVTGVLGKNGSSAQAYLRELTGVTGVFTRNVSYGNMRFDINFVGTTEDFLNLLEANGIQVLEMTSEFIKI